MLETSHPPVYYMPEGDVNWEYMREANGSTACEWKGTARYFDVVVGDTVRSRAAWSYPNPGAGSEVLRDAVAFYAGMADRCTVDGETVAPQPGRFYGGWITSDIVGPFKGGPGTAGW